MAVTIRLRREGTKDAPYYKVVVTDTRARRDGRFIEIVGTYDSKKAGTNAKLEMDRIDYWLSCGAQTSDTVKSLIKKAKKAATDAPQAVEAAA